METATAAPADSCFVVSKNVQAAIRKFANEDKGLCLWHVFNASQLKAFVQVCAHANTTQKCCPVEFSHRGIALRNAQKTQHPKMLLRAELNNAVLRDDDPINELELESWWPVTDRTAEGHAYREVNIYWGSFKYTMSSNSKTHAYAILGIPRAPAQRKLYIAVLNMRNIALTGKVEPVSQQELLDLMVEGEFRQGSLQFKTVCIPEEETLVRMRFPNTGLQPAVNALRNSFKTKRGRYRLGVSVKVAREDLGGAEQEEEKKVLGEGKPPDLLPAPEPSPPPPPPAADDDNVDGEVEPPVPLPAAPEKLTIVVGEEDIDRELALHREARARERKREKEKKSLAPSMSRAQRELMRAAAKKNQGDLVSMFKKRKSCASRAAADAPAAQAKRKKLAPPEDAEEPAEDEPSPPPPPPPPPQRQAACASQMMLSVTSNIGTIEHVAHPFQVEVPNGELPLEQVAKLGEINFSIFTNIVTATLVSFTWIEICATRSLVEISLEMQGVGRIRAFFQREDDGSPSPAGQGTPEGEFSPPPSESCGLSPAADEEGEASLEPLSPGMEKMITSLMDHTSNPCETSELFGGGGGGSGPTACVMDGTENVFSFLTKEGGGDGTAPQAAAEPGKNMVADLFDVDLSLFP